VAIIIYKAEDGKGQKEMGIFIKLIKATAWTYNYNSETLHVDLINLN